jgi:hypothetical protein
MTFDEIEASVRILKRHDERALVDFTPEGGTFSVIYCNPRMGDAEVADILGELLKMSFVDLSRTAITDAGVIAHRREDAPCGRSAARDFGRDGPHSDAGSDHAVGARHSRVPASGIRGSGRGAGTRPSFRSPPQALQPTRLKWRAGS